MNGVVFHRHGGRDWPCDAACPICDNDRLRERLFRTQDSHAQWQAECLKLYDLIRDARKRVSWMMMATPHTTQGWAECSDLVDEFDKALTITGDRYWKDTTADKSEDAVK